MLKSILFDVDGVLLDSFPVNLEFFQRLMAHLHCPIPSAETYKNYYHMTLPDVIAHLTKESDMSKIEKIVELVLSGKIHYYMECLELCDGLLEVLPVLQERYQLGIVTSRYKDRMFVVPALAKIKHFFQIVVCLEDVKHPKPDPEPLLLACERLGIKPTEAIYIGDALTDIQAAKAAKMKGVLYTGVNDVAVGAVRNSSQIEADFVIQDLRQIIEVVAKLN